MLSTVQAAEEIKRSGRYIIANLGDLILWLWHINVIFGPIISHDIIVANRSRRSGDVVTYDSGSKKLNLALTIFCINNAQHNHTLYKTNKLWTNEPVTVSMIRHHWALCEGQSNNWTGNPFYCIIIMDAPHTRHTGHAKHRRRSSINLPMLMDRVSNTFLVMCRGWHGWSKFYPF